MTVVREDGFTLVELMVVVVILGILATMGLPVFTTVRDRAYAGAVNNDLRNAATLMTAYHTAEGRFPLAGEVSLDTTPGVTLTVQLPTAPGAAQDFCLEGAHARLGSGGVATYDTRAGGLTSSTSC